MMNPSTTIYRYRVDIVRKHLKIGEARAEAGTVHYDSTADVMRSLQCQVPCDGFSIPDIIEITDNSRRRVPQRFDLFKDRLRPVIEIGGDEITLGDFVVIASPTTIINGREYYNVEAYDETMILKQAKCLERKYIPANTLYIEAITELLLECGLSNIVHDECDLRTTIDREFETGTAYLQIINALLEEIAFAPVHAGGDGAIHLQRKTVKYSADYTYTERNSTIIDKITKSTDLYNIPNVLIGYVSNPDIEKPLKYTRTNSDPSSKTSTWSRGYNVVSAYELSDCPNIETLKAIIDQKYFESTQATEKIELETMPDGPHEYNTYVSCSSDGAESLFEEVAWTLSFGGTLTHTLERKVFT